MIKKIMLAYRDTKEAGRALEKTADLAKLWGSEVYVITVENIPEYAETMDEIEDEVERQDKGYSKINEEAVKYLKDRGLTVHPVIAYGRASKEIIIHAKGHEVDLIIMGRKKHSSIGKKLCHIFGCTTGIVLEHAHCSVLVVK